MENLQTGFDLTRKQPLFNHVQVIYKNDPIFVRKWVKAGLNLTDKLYLVIHRKAYAIFEVKLETMQDCNLISGRLSMQVKREWKDTLLNAMNITMFEEEIAFKDIKSS